MERFGISENWILLNKMLRTYLYIYMHVYKRMRLFAHAHLSVHVCKEQIRAEATFDFPIYVYFNYHS